MTTQTATPTTLETLRCPRDNWLGGDAEVAVNRTTGEFTVAHLKETFVLTQKEHTVEEYSKESGVGMDFTLWEVRRPGGEYPLCKVTKMVITYGNGKVDDDGGLCEARDDGDHGIGRWDKDPVLAAVKILCNII